MEKDEKIIHDSANLPNSEYVSQLEGDSLTPPPLHLAGSNPIQLQDRDKKQELIDKGQDELNRRIEAGGPPSDGSGEWGADADDRGTSDYANHYMFGRVALAAETMGYTNAARHMRHYLGNTGNPLEVNVDSMLRDVEPFSLAYDNYIPEVKSKVNDYVKNLNQSLDEPKEVSFTGTRSSSVYCGKGDSPDWFYAIGGFTHWWTADVTVSQSRDSNTYDVEIKMKIHIKDRYNWDKGKSVNIGPLEIKDKQLGRLHEVGLAKEYDVFGESSIRRINYTVEHTDTFTDNPEQIDSDINEREGTRSDPLRNRGRAPIPGRNRK
ncbi:MAG: hypothetical protein AAF587_39230 [Bacteroidota bacterium]